MKKIVSVRLRLNKVVLSFISAFLIFSISTPVFAQVLKPGMWQSKTKFKLNGLPMPSKDDQSCITADEAKTPKATIEKALKRNDCQLTKWDLKAGEVAASVKCKNKQYDASGSLKGTFQPTSYHLVGQIEGTHQLLGQAKAEVNFDGDRTGDCKPADAKKK